MKALSIRQPWAWLILNAGKDIENRCWPTKFCGEFLIHAAKGMTRDEYASAASFYEDIIEARWKAGAGIITPLPAFKELERGGIVGVANLVECVDLHDSPWFCGEYGFVLKDARSVPFTPCKGMLLFFTVPDAVVATLNLGGAR